MTSPGRFRQRLIRRVIVGLAVAIGAVTIAAGVYAAVVFVSVGLYIEALVNPPNMNAVYVTNTGAGTWLVRAPAFYDDGGALVARISPGADGAVYMWPRGETPVVEVLEFPNCTLLGRIAVMEGESHSVDPAPGLTVLIRNRSGRNNVPEIETVNMCGGRV